MEKEVKLPSVSEEAGTATVAEIYVKEGDTVEEGQDLIAVDSDKASVDVPSDAAGKVKSIKVSTGDEVSPGDVIVVLETEEASGSEKEDTGKEDKKEKSPEEEEEEPKEGSEDREEPDAGKDDKGDGEEAAEKPDKEQEEEGDDESEGEGKDKGEGEDEKKSAEEDRKKEHPEPSSAPLAKKFARELGIDISDLAKDDPRKRITRDDVMAYAKKLIRQGEQAGKAPAAGGVPPIELPDFSRWGDFDKEPLDGIRTRIGENTVLSWQNIPHVTQHDKADMTEMMEFRKKMSEKEQKISITALLVKISGAALKRFPRFNSSIDLANREIYLKKYCHISVAVDTDNGLLMPVIRDVDRKSVQDISRELAELAEKARNRKLKADEMKGGNFAVSNLGGIGGTYFTPVIFPPQVAILGVSAPQTEPVFNGEEWEPKDFMPLSLSYDHRAIDGADAARFLRWICEVIEQPFNLL